MCARARDARERNGARLAAQRGAGHGFLIAIPVLGGMLALIATRAFPRFQVMLEKFDGLNARVQETLMAIRVVKAFVRSKFEKEKFEVTNDDLKRASIMAEKSLFGTAR